MKKTNIIAIIIIAVVVGSGAFLLFQGSYVTTAEATVSEIVEEPTAFDTQEVQMQGIVRNWDIRNYTISITGPDVNKTFEITRYYLVIEDLNTDDRIKIRLNYRNKTPELTAETFSIDETVTVEGIVKEFKFEEDIEDIDIDLVVIAKQIVKENGEVISIITDEDIDNFRARRQAIRERRQNRNIQDHIEEITAEVLFWEFYEYNITITGPEDFYVSKIVIRPLLLVQNTETNERILVIVSFPRVNLTIEEDFIAIGEIITLRGIIRNKELNTEKFEGLEHDQVMLAIKITNSDDESIDLISLEAFQNARPRRRYRIWNRRR